jgi:hypothetical protein
VFDKNRLINASHRSSVLDKGVVDITVKHSEKPKNENLKK